MKSKGAVTRIEFYTPSQLAAMTPEKRNAAFARLIKEKLAPEKYATTGTEMTEAADDGAGGGTRPADPFKLD